MREVHFSIDDVRSLTLDALVGSGTSPRSAEIVTRSIVASELDGIDSHGLARLPTDCEHADADFHTLGGVPVRGTSRIQKSINIQCQWEISHAV